MNEPLISDRNGAVWMDRPEIEGGDRWKKEIDQALYRSRIVLAVLTARSVDPKRRWIRYEHVEARRLFRRVVPLLLEDCEIPEYFKDLHYVDFRADWEDGFRDLRNTIAKVAPRLGPSGSKFVDATPPLDRAFIGRQEDLEAAFELIDGESKSVETGRLAVAIQGMGGTGKTMLAHELARRIAVHYPGGVATGSAGPEPRFRRSGAPEVGEVHARKLPPAPLDRGRCALEPPREIRRDPRPSRRRPRGGPRPRAAAARGVAARRDADHHDPARRRGCSPWLSRLSPPGVR